MVDGVSKEVRSRVMAAIRSSGNMRTELVLARLLRAHRLSGWRRGHALLGKPDFVFAKEKLAVFVDGCFWHGCPLHCRMPKSRKGYWNPKIARNALRDKHVTRALRRAGWRVLRIWEHHLKDPERVAERVKRALIPTRRSTTQRKLERPPAIV